MSGRVLLDTNIVIALFGVEDSIVRRVATAAEILIPVAVLGELWYGASHSRRSVENLAKIREFRDNVVVVPATSLTAEVYGEIKSALRAAGTPLPENDIWIAAQAIEHDLPLVSRDKHFTKIPRLRLEAW